MSTLFRRIGSIRAEQAMARLSVGALVLVDVREPVELRAGRVRGAVNIPLRELRARLRELDCEQPVLVTFAEVALDNTASVGDSRMWAIRTSGSRPNNSSGRFRNGRGGAA